MTACSVAQCGRAVFAAGLCQLHYHRRWKYGDVGPVDPLVGIDPRIRIERFLTRPTGDSGCWLFNGTLNVRGYGTFNGQLAHRFMYEHHIGPIPGGLVLDHLCCTPACVNPAHLEPVTVAENNQRAGQRRDSCRRGHPRTPENLYVSPRGERDCLACIRLRTERQQAVKRAARPPRSCLHCGIDISHRHGGARFCGEQCKYAERVARQNAPRGLAS